MRSLKHHQVLYSPLYRTGIGQIQLHLNDAGTKFNDISHLQTGILERNEGFTSRSDPDPTRRFLYNLRPGQYIENDNLSGRQITRPNIVDPMPMTWQGGHGVKMPNFTVGLKQYIKELDDWITAPRLDFEWSQCEKWAPIGQWLDGVGELQEQYVDHFYKPQAGGDNTMVLVAVPGGGTYGLKYQEGIEAEGGRNTSNKDPVTGRTTWQLEASQFEPVEDVFFHSFDTTDLENFKITNDNHPGAKEATFHLTTGEERTARLNIHLVPRQWYYFVYALSWYLIITPFTYFYHPQPVADGWYDRTPVHPYPFTGFNYYGDIYGGRDDYGVYWKVIHSQEFLDILSALNDLQMSSYYMGIVWVGVEYFYYRVRCFPALQNQLCAVIEDRDSGAKWYIWRRTKEDKDTITLVDSYFWPENYSNTNI